MIVVVVFRRMVDIERLISSQQTRDYESMLF